VNPYQAFLNPRQAFLRSRHAARHGHVYTDGGRVPISFSRDTQDRINELAAIWEVPRAEIVRFLVELSLPILDQFTDREREVDGDAVRD